MLVNYCLLLLGAVGAGAAAGQVRSARVVPSRPSPLLLLPAATLPHTRGRCSASASHLAKALLSQGMPARLTQRALVLSRPSGNWLPPAAGVRGRMQC